MKEQGNHQEDPGIIHRRVYPHRVIGMGLAFVPIYLVFKQINAPIYSWIWAIFSCLIWPHLAYLLASRNEQPSTIERRNLTIDSFIAGSIAPLLHFNILPSVMLIAITMADKFSTGVKRMWQYGAIFVILGILFGGIFTGFRIDLDSSTSIILATLPILIVHTMVVSYTSYRLIRKVHFKNEHLKELTQKDPLTALYNCRAWQEKAQSRFENLRFQATPLSLIIIDIDEFKEVNDKYGHSVGDDLILNITEIIKYNAGESACTGRLGGDEFVTIIEGNAKKSRRIAQKIIEKVREITLPQTGLYQFSVSIGASCTSLKFGSYLDWFNSADKALYAAKHLGRNTLVIADK